MIAYLLVVLGVLTACAGIALVSIPAAVVLAGVALVAAGLLIDFDGKGAA